MLLLITGCGNKQRDQTVADNTQPPKEKPQNPNADGRSPPFVPPHVLWLTELLNYHQQAPTITTDLLIRVKSPNGDPLLFQINLWCPADGRVRLKCSKLDVDFIDALVQPNGDFVLELVRSKEVVSGNLRDIKVFDATGAVSGPPFLAYLNVLVQEAKVGPVPDRGVTQTGDGVIHAKDHITGLNIITTVNPDDTVAQKRYFDAPDKEALRLDYYRYEQFNQLKRAKKIQLTVPGDATEYTVSMRHIDAVPSIPADHMRFKPSVGSTHIGLEEFLKRLRD
jgi:hypothetical protein